MAKLLFALLCEGAIKNSTGSIDINNVIAGAEFSLSKSEEASDATNDDESQSKCEIVTRWARSDNDTPENVLARLQFLNEKNKKLVSDFEMPIDLSDVNSVFVITQLKKLPYVKSSGLYRFQVQVKKNGRWNSVGEIPVYLSVLDDISEASELLSQ